METEITKTSTSFYDRPGVEKSIIPIGKGIPFGMERVSNPKIGIGGVYGTWGDSYDNETLHFFLEQRLGHPLPPQEKLNLSELGFLNRQHIPLNLTPEEHIQLEVEVGARFLTEAMKACNWKPSEVEGVLIGVSVDNTLLLVTHLHHQILHAIDLPGISWFYRE